MTFNFNVKADIRIYDSSENGGEFHRRLNVLLDELESLGAKPTGSRSTGERRMKTMPSTAEQAIIDRFNTATNVVAARIRELVSNPPDDTEFNAQLESIASGLEALGAPGTPLPPA